MDANEKAKKRDAKAILAEKKKRQIVRIVDLITWIWLAIITAYEIYKRV